MSIHKHNHHQTRAFLLHLLKLDSHVVNRAIGEKRAPSGNQLHTTDQRLTDQFRRHAVHDGLVVRVRVAHYHHGEQVATLDGIHRRALEGQIVPARRIPLTPVLRLHDPVFAVEQLGWGQHRSGHLGGLGADLVEPKGSGGGAVAQHIHHRVLVVCDVVHSDLRRHRGILDHRRIEVRVFFYQVVAHLSRWDGHQLRRIQFLAAVGAHVHRGQVRVLDWLVARVGARLQGIILLHSVRLALVLEARVWVVGRRAQVASLLHEPQVRNFHADLTNGIFN
mmetsp:Transcript_43961/g.76557  ORF Transcript_43961/g.76557 Transcript_43961/m.76557 type:complete len:278 (-) Transcript_43961:94-927(-)